jgi:uncharacterized membrane protein/heat shock protein HslJ
MKFLLKIITLLTITAFISCGSNKKQKSNIPSAKNTTKTGIFIGEIPCASCEAIVFEIQLNADNSYQQTLIYRGESKTAIVNNGIFSISNEGIIQLDENAGSLNYLKAIPNGLLLLDKNGKVIEGALATNYILIPKNNTSENNETAGFQQILLKKQQEGIDFYATGNEPFWSLEMDFDNLMRFKTMDGLVFNAPAVQPNLAQDHNVKRFRAITESGEIIIQIIESQCSDTMADQKFPYQVIIDFKTSKETEYTNFKGCGMYVPDYRLTDIWAIVEVNNTQINASNYQNNAPQLEINSFNKTVFGTDGCNTFRGSIVNEENKLFFGPMASTLMVCNENEEIATAINIALSKNRLTYSLIDNHLTIFSNQEKIMVLKHLN